MYFTKYIVIILFIEFFYNFGHCSDFRYCIKMRYEQPKTFVYSVLLARRKGKVKPSQNGWACLHFPFPPGKQGIVITLLKPSSYRAPHC